MTNKTALYEQHIANHGKMVDFASWSMPIHYGSQIQEHHQIRRDAGMFDVSHMVILDFKGPQVRPFLRQLLANDIGRLKDSGKALYSCMLNEQAGVIDDLIVYYLDNEWYRMVVNAATRENDLNWITQQAKNFKLEIIERSELAMIAVQGPNARQKCHAALGDKIAKAHDLKPFFASQCGELFIARTGYTGEDGYEIMIPNEQAAAIWDLLLAQNIKPCGLGARDTLRLEAGMNLYGQDMDETVTPLESGLGWTVAWEPADRNFIGREQLERQRKSAPASKFVGLILEAKGVLRSHQKVVADNIGEGEITSGSFSPTLNVSIAMARVPKQTGATCTVEIRNKFLSAKVVKLPFVRKGKSCYTI